MTLRLPPRYYNTPTHARFRKHRLPAELWDTWELLNALSWVNDYKFTPPTSLRDLARFLGVKEDAVRDRLARLSALGWLQITRQSGKESIYFPIVPDDTPDSCGEAASMISPVASEDSSGLSETAENSARDPSRGGACRNVEDTPVVDYRGRNSVVVDSISSNPEKNSTTTNTIKAPVRATRSKEETYRIGDALADLDLETDEAVEEILALEHVTAEYCEDWILHKRFAGQKLGGGYYRIQIREKRASPYVMSKKQRADYRSEKDDEWERDQMDQPSGEGDGD